MERHHRGTPASQGGRFRTDAQSEPSVALPDTPWPPHGVERLPWSQSVRGGTRADRTLDRIDATLPPLIAHLDYSPTPALTALTEQTLIHISRAEAETTGMPALGQFLIRTDSVSSSKIEHDEATTEDYARALAGSRANDSARSMVAATRALTDLVDDVGAQGRISNDAILSAHHRLMADDRTEGRYAGAWRPMQNWIGGSDHSPRDALHIPPAPERVEHLMADLVDYLNRDNLPVIVQAAIGHAQFESIHPFTDGNGRIGRALINAVLRRRGITTTSVVPVASALLAEREHYFQLLNAYRTGDVDPFVHNLATGMSVAAQESRASAAQLAALPSSWAEAVRFRSGSAGQKILGDLLDHPVFTVDELTTITGSGPSNLAPAIIRLEQADLIREITGRQRDRVWVATDVAGELDDLEQRILRRMRAAVTVWAHPGQSQGQSDASRPRARPT